MVRSANNRHSANPSTPNWRSCQRAASTSTESNRTGNKRFTRPASPPPLLGIRPLEFRGWLWLSTANECATGSAFWSITRARGYCRLVKQHLDRPESVLRAFHFGPRYPEERGAVWVEAERHSSVDESVAASAGSLKIRARHQCDHHTRVFLPWYIANAIYLFLQYQKFFIKIFSLETKLSKSK